MSNVIQMPVNDYASDYCTGAGIAIDAYMEHKDGKPLKAIAKEYAESLLESLDDSTQAEKLALLEGFVYRSLELAA